MNNISGVEINCFGCSACENICPHRAIKMVANEEGFLYPEIDNSKCINCGACKKVCPALKQGYKNSTKPKCFAIMADDETRYNSSSGGVFPILAYHFLKNDGYVAGAVWGDKGEVKHIVSNKKSDIENMRGSKYLQSTIGECYKDVKTILEKRSKVLFTGTPCQIAGLKSYLNKEYQNLYTVEIICHGASSPGVFKQYLNETLEDGEKFISTKFRDKIKGWSHDIIITTKTNLKETSSHLEKSFFTRAFNENLCLRPTCEKCKFNRIPRQADITIGDFWGVWNFNHKLDDKKGTSIILINNTQGKKLFDYCKDLFKLVQPVPFKKAINGNPNLIMPTKVDKRKRETFMNLVKTNTVQEAFEYCMEDKADCMILNYWHAINYGAILTCYGVQCLAEKIGLKPKVINYLTTFKKDFPGSFSEKFAQKYLNLTEPVKNMEDFIALNSKCKTFITGSDQVWAPGLMKGHCDDATQSIYLLDFVKNGRKKLSYSASFGYPKFLGDPEQENLFKHFLKQFDSISVREDDAINVLKDLGITEATHLLDGAFLIPKENLKKMTENYNSSEKYIACFVLPYFKEANWYKDFLLQAEQYLNLPIKPFEFDNKTPVEEWLAYIKNAEFVITDSFHGVVFSIIFNKSFVQVKNASSQNRFESLFRVLDIENNSLGEYDKINFNKIFIERDWEKINKKIENEIKKAERWLKKAIDSSPKDNSEYDFQNYLLIKSSIKELELQRKLRLLKNKDKYLRKYYLYKVLSSISFGKSRKKVKEKLNKYNKLKRVIRKL